MAPYPGIPFDVVIPEPERDSQLGERLELAADAILAWAVAGWAQYREGGMNPPPAARKATDDYQRTSDDGRRFVETECIANPNMWAAMADLWARWESWRADDGAEPLSTKAFGQALDQHGFPADKGSRGVRIRRGLGLAAEDDDEPWTDR